MGIYSMSGSSVNVYVDSKIVVSFAMATVDDISELNDGQIYTWYASYTYNGNEIRASTTLTANFSVIIDNDIKLDLERTEGDQVMHPGDKMSVLITAIFPQYFFGNIRLKVSTEYETDPEIRTFGYFTQEPQLQDKSGADMRDTHSYIASTRYKYAAYTRSEADFSASLAEERMVKIGLTFILTNMEDILDNTNYTMNATLTQDGEILKIAQLSFITNLTTEEPFINATVDFPSVLYFNQPEAMLINIKVKGKSAHWITAYVDFNGLNDIVICQKTFYNMGTFCADYRYIDIDSTASGGKKYDFGALINCRKF
ncbi:uncharacterized protein [Antedon mediterranea]|uniref:uncharacterized protein n=1 Tax=Antedon mediterranea TaxID=105859 RepID=UPI003AF4BE04